MPPATDSYGTSAGGPTRDEPRTGRLRFLVGELGFGALRHTPWRWPKSIPQASKAQSAGTTTATSDAGANAKAGVPGLGEDGEQPGGYGRQRAAQNGAPARQGAVALRRDHGGRLLVNRGSRAGAPGMRLEGTCGRRSGRS